MEYFDFVCGNCGKEFKSKFKDAKYCCRSCSSIDIYKKRAKVPVILYKCQECGREYKPWNRQYSKYCSHSCSAIASNRKRIIKYQCLNCGNECGKNANKYCCKKCMWEYKNKEFISEWNTNPEKFCGEDLTDRLRRHILECNGNKCSKCGWNEINPRTNLIPLQVHHKDGNYRNNMPENLEVLCPNCHSLTPTYGSGNKGNGREYRYK